MKINIKIFPAAVSFLFPVLFSIRAFCGDVCIYGDSQQNPDVQSKIVQEIIAFHPSVVFRVGDLVDDGREPGLWEQFNAIHGPLMKTAEYFPALGNHEFDSQLYFEQFPQLEGRRWYSVEREGMHFTILDSCFDMSPGSVQYNWLEDDLSAVSGKNMVKAVIFHHPLFDVSKRHGADEKNLRPVLLPLFEKYGVSAVFCGHSHDYQRYNYKGIYFIVTGGGGSTLYGQKTDDPYLQKFAKVYHFCLLRTEAGAVSVKVIDVDLNVIDTFELPVKTGVVEAGAK